MLVCVIKAEGETLRAAFVIRDFQPQELQQLTMLLVLVLVLLGPRGLGTSSPCYSDMNKDHRPRVSCVGQNLSAVPDGTDLGTQVLVLSQNQFVSLSWASYEKFTDLHELDLSQNHVGVIDPSGPVLQNLKVLRLSRNRLEGLGGRVFRFAPALMEVYLDGNGLRTLHDATFGDLPQLEIINLLGNHLPALPRRLLHSVSSTSLKTFDLEDNRVRHLPDGFFNSTPNLPYVYLSQNPWLCNCQVSYLHHYLNEEGGNVYKHTTGTAPVVPGDRDMETNIENDPESVVCSEPPTLQGRAILDLSEDEYCPTSPPEESSTHSVHRPETSESFTSLATTATTQKSVTTTKAIREVATPTATTIPPIPEASTFWHSSRAWTGFESWTVRHFWTEVWRYVVSESFNQTVATEVHPTDSSNHQETSHTVLASTVQPRTSTVPLPWTSRPEPWTSRPEPWTSRPEPWTSRPEPWTSRPEPWTSRPEPWTSRPEPWTSRPEPWTSRPEPWTSRPEPQAMSVTSRPRTPTPSSSTIPDPETSVPFRYVFGRPSACAVPWCWWLFAGFLPLCVLSALCSCMLFLWILITYLTLYRPVKRYIRKRDGGVTLLNFRNKPGSTSGGGGGTARDVVLFLPPEKIPVENQAVFRSVLFIVKEDEEGEKEQRREGERDEDNNVTTVELVPTEMKEKEERAKVRTQRDKEGQSEATDSQKVFRKTLYRVISREEEIEDWREVEESWGLAERGVGERGMGERRMGERGKKRYSLILREERGSVVDGDGGLEWLVGEWEMGGGGRMREGSWGSLIRRAGGGASLTPPTTFEGSQMNKIEVGGASTERGVARAEGGGANAEIIGATAEVGGATAGGGVATAEEGGAADTPSRWAWSNATEI